LAEYSPENTVWPEKTEIYEEVTEPAVINMMKGIKALVDPNNIMNPGKIWE
jgi:FAD/FMN-containing dehydrogenase